MMRAAFSRVLSIGPHATTAAASMPRVNSPLTAQPSRGAMMKTTSSPSSSSFGMCTTTTRRCFSSTAAASSAISAASTSPTPQLAFDGEIADIYGNFFVQLTPTWEHHVKMLKKHKVTNPQSILDLASGPGMPGVLLATEYPDATVHLTDIAPDMVSQAKSRVAEAGDDVSRRVNCEVVDMQSMTSIEDNSVDVVTVSFGLMFPPSLPAALSEIHRVLKPGGVMTATVWKEMPMIPMVGAVMTKVLGTTSPPPPINPLSLAENSALDVPLAEAGLQLVDHETASLIFKLPSDPELAWKMGMLVSLAKLKELQESGSHGDVMAKARTAFEEETAGWKDDDGHVIIPTATYRLIACRKQ